MSIILLLKEFLQGKCCYPHFLESLVKSTCVSEILARFGEVLVHFSKIFFLLLTMALDFYVACAFL